MIKTFECLFCGVTVEYVPWEYEENVEFDCCLNCWEKESDTGEIY